jgi:hypothetical protein
LSKLLGLSLVAIEKREKAGTVPGPMLLNLHFIEILILSTKNQDFEKVLMKVQSCRKSMERILA